MNIPSYLSRRVLFNLSFTRACTRCKNANTSSNSIRFNSYKGNIRDPRTTRNYAVAAGLFALGCSFGAVPLYRIFCQSTGYGGTVKHDLSGEKVEAMKKNQSRKITVKFTSDVNNNLIWDFKPQQNEIVVYPGETALAFYTAKNPTDTAITGISTYNILPYNAAPYFNKIQCFCFEEQRLNPNEEVDMPVFFYIDPDFCEDPQMENINEVILSYTFFEAKQNMPLFSSTT